jgi:hypothetical protein
LFYHTIQLKINLYIDNITENDADGVLTNYTKFVRESAKERQQVSLNLQRSSIFWDITQRVVLNSVPTFRVNLGPVVDFLTLEYGTDTLPGNVRKKLTLYAA